MSIAQICQTGLFIMNHDSLKELGQPDFIPSYATLGMLLYHMSRVLC